MRLSDYRLGFIAVGLIGILLIASPILGTLIRFPSGEPFSELYILGPEHMAENYPYNIRVGQNYSIYAGVGNHMGSPIYYVLYVKFRNQTDNMPNATIGTSSSLQPLYEYRFIIQDGKYWENLLTFSILNASVSGNNFLVNSLTINDTFFDVKKPIVWNETDRVFDYELFFELWAYNTKSGSIQFDNRFVNLKLNITVSN